MIYNFDFRKSLGQNFLIDDSVVDNIANAIDYKENNINKEFQEVYFIKKAIPLSKFILPPDEVAGMVELPVEKCMKLFSNEIDHFYANGIFNDDESSGKPYIKNVKLTNDDFIQFVDNFHFKIMVLAQRSLANEKYLFI